MAEEDLRRIQLDGRPSPPRDKRPRLSTIGAYEPLRRTEIKNLVRRPRLQRKFSGDVRLHGIWVLRHGHRQRFLPQRKPFPVAHVVTDDVWGGISDAAPRRHRARCVHRSPWPPRRPHSDSESHVRGHLFDFLHSAVTNDQLAGSLSFFYW